MLQVARIRGGHELKGSSLTAGSTTAAELPTLIEHHCTHPRVRRGDGALGRGLIHRLVHPLFVLKHGSPDRVDMRATTAVATPHKVALIHLLPSGLLPSAPESHRIGLITKKFIHRSIGDP
jgi:hypothetical protein